VVIYRAYLKEVLEAFTAHLTSSMMSSQRRATSCHCSAPRGRHEAATVADDRSDCTAVAPPMLTTMLSSVLGELLYIAGPACLWWVWPGAGKLLLALVLLCRGLGTHRVLRLPIGHHAPLTAHRSPLTPHPSPPAPHQEACSACCSRSTSFSTSSCGS
jgi:hypothetical protein